MILPKEIKLTKKTKRNGSCNACSFESGRYEAGFHELKRDTYDLVHIPFQHQYWHFRLIIFVYCLHCPSLHNTFAIFSFLESDYMHIWIA